MKVPTPHDLNTTTRCFQRRMSDAFPLHHDTAPLYVEYMPLHKSDKIVIFGCVVAAVLLAVVLGVWR